MYHSNDILVYLVIFFIACFCAFIGTVLIDLLLKHGKIQNFFKNVNWSKVLPWSLFIIGSLLYGAFSYFRYNSVGYPLRDLGLFSQAIWHFSLFELPASSIKGVVNLWADHFHPILAVLSPIYWFKPDTRTLLIVQAIIISAGVFPIFQIALKKLKNNFVAFAFAFAWLFFLGTQQVFGFGFYPETLAIVFLGYAYYFFWEKKYWPYALFLVLAMMCKENISIYVVFFGLYVFFFENRMVGLWTFLSGVGWFKFALMVMDKLNGNNYPYFNYDQLGTNFTTAIQTILVKPIYALQVFFTPLIKIKTMLVFFTSVGFLSFFSPFMIAVLPNLAEKFFSSRPILWEVGYEYGAGISTSLFVAAILGLANIMKWKIVENSRFTKQTQFIFVGILLITLNFGTILVDKDGLLIKMFYPETYKLKIDKNIQEVIDLIPKQASVEVQETLGTFFANREFVYRYPNSEKSDYIVLTPFYYDDSFNQDNYKMFSFSSSRLRGQMLDLYEGTRYYVYYCNSEVIVFKRGNEQNKPLSREIEKFLFKYKPELIKGN